MKSESGFYLALASQPVKGGGGKKESKQKNYHRPTRVHHFKILTHVMLYVVGISPVSPFG